MFKIFILTAIVLVLLLPSCKPEDDSPEPISMQKDANVQEGQEEQEFYDAETKAFLLNWRILPGFIEQSNNSLKLTVGSGLKNLADILGSSKNSKWHKGITFKEKGGKIEIPSPSRQQKQAGKVDESEEVPEIEQLLKESDYKVELRLGRDDFMFTSKDGKEQFLYIKSDQGNAKIVEMRELEGGNLWVSDGLTGWSIKGNPDVLLDDTVFQIAHYLADLRRIEGGTAGVGKLQELAELYAKIDIAIKPNNVSVNLVENLNIPRVNAKIKTLRDKGQIPTNSAVSQLFDDAIAAGQGPTLAIAIAKWKPDDILSVINYRSFPNLNPEQTARIAQTMAESGNSNKIFEFLSNRKAAQLDDTATFELAEKLVVRNNGRDLVTELNNHPKASRLDDEDLEDLFEQ